MSTIDATDLEILEVLRTNGRLSTREIGKKTGIPAATVYKRMKRLEIDGVIEGYGVKVNREKLGQKTFAYVFIRSIPGADQRDILTAAIKEPQVEDLAAITGQFDIMLKVRVKDTDELSDFLFMKVRNFPSVAHTETFLGLNLKPFQEGMKKLNGQGGKQLVLP